jgi:hypothetical protein
MYCDRMPIANLAPAARPGGVSPPSLVPAAVLWRMNKISVSANDGGRGTQLGCQSALGRVSMPACCLSHGNTTCLLMSAFL